jgi:hypothetical protein
LILSLRVIVSDFSERENRAGKDCLVCNLPSLRSGSQAVELATQANPLAGSRNPIFLRTLAAAYAENGQFSRAAEIATSAMELADTQRNRALAQALRNEIALYQSELPYREP